MLANPDNDKIALRLNEAQRSCFWGKVRRSDTCWEWTGYLHNGYGKFFASKKGLRAHRVSYILTHGLFDATLFVDHICRNRPCVNPAHLRIVSARENTLENSASLPCQNAAKTHCPRGHPLSGANLSTIRKQRVCKECKRVESVARRARLKAAHTAPVAGSSDNG